MAALPECVLLAVRIRTGHSPEQVIHDCSLNEVGLVVWGGRIHHFPWDYVVNA